jgi:hypothetical protein
MLAAIIFKEYSVFVFYCRSKMSDGTENKVGDVFEPQIDAGNPVDLTGVTPATLTLKQIMVSILSDPPRDYKKERPWPPKPTTIKICPPKKPVVDGESAMDVDETQPTYVAAPQPDLIAAELEYFKSHPPRDFDSKIKTEQKTTEKEALTRKIRNRLHKIGFVARLIYSHEIPSDANWALLSDVEKFQAVYALYVSTLTFAADKKNLEANLAIRKEKQIAFLDLLQTRLDSLDEDVYKMNDVVCDAIKKLLLQKSDDPEAKIYEIRREIIKVLKREAPVPSNPKLVKEIWNEPTDLYDLRHVFVEDVVFLNLSTEDLAIFNTRTVDGEFHEQYFWRLTPNIDLNGDIAKLSGFSALLEKAKTEVTAVKTALGIANTSNEIGFENCEQQIEFPDYFLTLEQLKHKPAVEQNGRYYQTPEHVMRLVDNPTCLSDWLPSYSGWTLQADIEQAGDWIGPNDADQSKMVFVDGFYFIDGSVPVGGQSLYIAEHAKQSGCWKKIDHFSKKYQLREMAEYRTIDDKKYTVIGDKSYQIQDRPAIESYAEAEPYKMDITKYPISVCGSLDYLNEDQSPKHKLVTTIFNDMFKKRKDYAYVVKEGPVQPLRIPDIVYRLPVSESGSEHRLPVSENTMNDAPSN